MDLNNFHILDPFGRDQNRLEVIFESMYKDDRAILLLGAGSSVTDRKFLSNEIIEYYKDEFSIDYSGNNIVEFVDNLSARPDFSRASFDNYVKGLLQKINPGDFHKILYEIKWREIITTNFDLLLERAEDLVRESPSKRFELFPIRENNQYYTTLERSNVKYVKLNGCLSDISKYKLVFSTEDFKKSSKFYKTVLNNLKTVSPEIIFLACGYSFSDPIAEIIFQYYDASNYRNRKILYSIDPFIDDFKLYKLKSDNVCVIKCSGDDFFSKYKEWASNIDESRARKAKGKFSNKLNQGFHLSHRGTYELAGVVEQLNDSYSGNVITEKAFYLGEEPDYYAIRNNYDIVNSDETNKVSIEILNLLKNFSHENIIPALIISGSYGAGKTTFIYRVLHNLKSNSVNDLLVFEIKDLYTLNRNSVKELILKIQESNIVFFVPDVDLYSTYKNLFEFRNVLSTEQIQQKNIVFLTSLRKYNLEKHKLSQTFNSNVHEFEFSGKLDSMEIDELLVKLRNHGLVEFRDNIEKSRLKEQIKTEFESDTFVSLLELVNKGKHFQDLHEAYLSLPMEGRKAFEYTALLHQFGIKMPISLLKNLVSQNWEEFVERIIKVDGKGILIQERSNTPGLTSDIFFRTKHKIVAEKLIEKLLPSESKKMRYFVNLINHIDANKESSFLMVNLLRILRINRVFEPNEINKLFKSAKTILENDPHFLLQYSLNLLRQNNLKSLLEADEVLVEAESMLSSRDHKFIHARASVSFELAKNYLLSGKIDHSLYHWENSIELFELKKIFDPCSSYSYSKYIQALIWKIENYELEIQDEVEIKVKLEDLINTAFRTVKDNINIINDLERKYRTLIGYDDYNSYEKELRNLYEDNIGSRPNILILMFNFYEQYEKYDELSEIIEELEYFSDEGFVQEFLYSYYGKRLFITDYRLKFFQLFSSLRLTNFSKTLRFMYYTYVAHAYNHHFDEAFSIIIEIKRQFYYLSPEFNLKWLEDYDEPKIFDGVIVLRSNRRFLEFKSYDLQKSFRIRNWTLFDLKESKKFKAVLHFNLVGIDCELLEEIFEL